MIPKGMLLVIIVTHIDAGGISVASGVAYAASGLHKLSKVYRPTMKAIHTGSQVRHWKKSLETDLVSMKQELKEFFTNDEGIRLINCKTKIYSDDNQTFACINPTDRIKRLR